MEVTQLNEEKKDLKLVQEELAKKRIRLINEQELLQEYSRSLVDMGKTAKPGQLVETDTLGMLLQAIKVPSSFCKYLWTLCVHALTYI